MIKNLEQYPIVNEVLWDKHGLIGFEKTIADHWEAGRIKGPVHLSGGNEEELLEIGKRIKPTDWVFSTWRSHYHALIKGVPSEWLEQEIVPLVPNHLQDVFDKNLPEGVNALFNRYKDTANNVVLPIYSFVKNKQHITCIYQDNKWEILENRKMNNYINFICDEFVAVFTNIWYTQNKIKISKDEKLKDLYLLYNKKVLGDGKKKEQLQNKIREDIKICFKQKINGIVSVEVE